MLMDAGCERHGYASDITRTWPVSGRFSGPQRDVYDVVLAAHRYGVARHVGRKRCMLHVRRTELAPWTAQLTGGTGGPDHLSSLLQQLCRASSTVLNPYIQYVGPGSWCQSVGRGLCCAPSIPEQSARCQRA